MSLLWSEKIQMAASFKIKKIMTSYLMLTASILSLVLGGVLSAGVPEDQANKKAVYRIYNQYKREFPHVQEISVSDAMGLYKDGKTVFVDLRTPPEMTISALPGAISRDEYLKNPAEFAGKMVIVYCTISYRSGIFARKMAEKGVALYNLAGGLLAWVHEEGKIYDAEGETKRIHVYGEKWNYPPTGYEAVKFGFFERLIR